MQYEFTIRGSFESTDDLTHMDDLMKRKLQGAFRDESCSYDTQDFNVNQINIESAEE